MDDVLFSSVGSDPLCRSLSSAPASPSPPPTKAKTGETEEKSVGDCLLSSTTMATTTTTTMTPPTIMPDDTVELDVCGVRMIVLRSTLCSGPPTSILMRMFDPSSDTNGWAPRKHNGVYFVDHDPRCFGIIVDTLRYGPDLVRFIGDRYDTARVRGMAAYFGLYDVEAQCKRVLARAENLDDPDDHVSINYLFEDSLGDGACHMGIGVGSSSLPIRRQCYAIEALDAVADALGMRRCDLAFYAARQCDDGTKWIDIGSRIDPASSTRVDQCSWCLDENRTLFVARGPLGPHIALCKVYTVSATDLWLTRARPIVFSLPRPYASAQDVVEAACTRVGIAPDGVVAAYVEMEHCYSLARLPYPAPIVGPTPPPGVDREETRSRMRPGNVLWLLVADLISPPDADAPRRLTTKMLKRWMKTIPV